MTHIHGFPAVADTNAHFLILGTMPGKVSLREGRYYANPRNQFWRIIGTLCGFDPAGSYELRVAAMLRSGIAIWDVAQCCTRASSLDSDIDDSTVVPNDLAWFVTAHPQLRCIAFNGGKAETLFYRHVVRTLPEGSTRRYSLLPSTSPAHTMPFERKLEAWRAGLEM